MNEEMIKRRLKEIRGSMRRLGLDGLVVTKTANVTYTTGFRGDASWAIITRRGAWLVTDSRYTEQAEKECAGCRIVERRTGLAEAAAEIVCAGRSKNLVGVEDNTSVAAFNALKKKLRRCVKPTSQIVEQARSCKETAEVNAIRQASRIALRALRQSLRQLKCGISENTFAGALESEIRKLQARCSFESIVAFGANSSQPHHRPGRRKLRQNDTVLIDFGVQYKGYCSDLTRCFSVGKSSSFYRMVYEAVRKAQDAAIRSIKAGVAISKVDAAAREVLLSCNLPVYGHGTGHGLGLEVHELPVVSGNTKGLLKAGQVITIEPGVYIPGKFGIRIEDDVLVTATGFRMLSKPDRFLFDARGIGHL